MKKIITIFTLMLFCFTLFCGCNINISKKTTEESSVEMTEESYVENTAVVGAPSADEIDDIISEYVDLTLYEVIDSRSGYAQYSCKEPTSYSFSTDFEIDGKPLSMPSSYSEIISAGFITNENLSEIVAPYTGQGYIFSTKDGKEVTFMLYNNTDKEGAAKDVSVIDGVQLYSPEWPEFSICDVTNNADIKDVIDTIGNPSYVSLTYYEGIETFVLSFDFIGNERILTVSVNADGDLSGVELT